MFYHRHLLVALIAVLFLSCAAWAQTGEEPAAAAVAPPVEGAAPAVVEPPLVPAAPLEAAPAIAVPEAAAPAHGEAAEGKKKEEEHWTLFNLIPMEWTYGIAVKVGALAGIPESQINEHLYNSHGLLHVMIMFFVLVLITLISVTVGGKYKRMLDNPAPQPGVSVSNFVEALVQTVLGMMEEIIGGHDSKKYLPLIGSLGFVILLNNLLGLIPGFYTATDNLNTTLAMAVVAWLLYHYYGIKTHGLGKYLAHFMGPLEGPVKYIMSPLMVPIELISHFARLLSLPLRLFGNMFGDHKVFAVFMGLVGVPLIYPLPFLALGLLVAVVQTLVFIMLTMVYIGLATAKSH